MFALLKEQLSQNDRWNSPDDGKRCGGKTFEVAHQFKLHGSTLPAFYNLNDVRARYPRMQIAQVTDQQDFVNSSRRC
jgi:hypothetical protein